MGNDSLGKRGTDRYERSEFNSEVSRSIDILRRSIGRLIRENGGVNLFADCFSQTIKIEGDRKGVRDIEMVITQLRVELENVFLQEKIPFQISELERSIEINPSNDYLKNIGYQTFSRRIDAKGRLSVGELQCLKEGFPVSLYSKEINGKIYIVISMNGRLGLFRCGYDQRCTHMDKIGRVLIPESVIHDIPEHGSDVKVIGLGSYAILVDNGVGCSAFASVEDYEDEVLPLLESQK
jgi:hypothetical protein